MSTESESSSVNCILCGQPIAPGEPAHVVLTGLYVGGNCENDFKPHNNLGFACGCLLRAAERHAEGLPVFDDDCTVTDYVKYVTDPNIPLRERIDYAVGEDATENTSEGV